MFEELDDRIDLDPNKKQAALDYLHKSQFGSTGFYCFDDHAGFRKGSIDLIMGTEGKGKSTFVRSVQLNIAKHHQILVYSSEENKKDTETMMYLRDADMSTASNIHFCEEDEVLDLCKSTSNFDEWRRVITVKLMNAGAEILFIDNITTSEFYVGSDYKNQIAFINALKKLKKELNIAIIVVAHAKKGTRDSQKNLIEASDVMGPATLANTAEYVHVFHLIRTKSRGMSAPTHPIIRVAKARFGSNVGNFYVLDYDHDKKEYTGDSRLSFEEFNKIFKDAQFLGKRD